uniref:Putative clade XVIII lectin receptor kinase n=1 Tax=Davidia involucrata TaxID=16924 RepID=A0A5B6ZF18_DAVIN
MGGQTGRATYKEKLHLWDEASGKMTDFTTHFSFVIDSNGSTQYADGLAFFLAPVNSSIPTDGGGGALGLGNNDINQTTNSAAYQFVAVEFDTYPNHWDPTGSTVHTHVGININSMRSVTTAIWWNDVSLGKQNDAWITYNSTSHNLSVVFTGFMNNQTQNGSLDHEVDLSDFLPELVIVGFSAAT